MNRLEKWRAETPAPAEVEKEVIKLRNECQALLEELESRVRHTLALPQRLQRRVVSWEEGAVHWLRTHPSWVVGIGVTAGAVVLGTALGRRAVRRRAERNIAQKLVGGLVHRLARGFASRRWAWR